MFTLKEDYGLPTGGIAMKHLMGALHFADLNNWGPPKMLSAPRSWVMKYWAPPADDKNFR